jgi:hypothetical protein
MAIQIRRQEFIVALGGTMRKPLVDKLPDGRIAMKAARPTGKISDVFDLFKRRNGPSLSIEQINKVAARGWAGRR